MKFFSKVKTALNKITTKTKKLETVYIVDDTAMERSMLKDYFSKYAHLKIKEYPKGTECINELMAGTAEKPDLIILDYFLDSVYNKPNHDVGPYAKLDGLGTLTKLKEICPDAGVIMYSTVDNELIIETAKEKGALDYVVKGATGFIALDSALQKHFSLQNNP